MIDTTSLFFIKAAVKHFIKENQILFETYKVGFYEFAGQDPVMSAKIFLPYNKTIEGTSKNSIDDLLLNLNRSLELIKNS